jgi:glutamine amidotransferase
MRKIRALVVDLKLNNIGSIVEALISSGYEVFTKINKDNIENSDILVLPGVGSYPAAMTFLKKKKIDILIKKFSKRKNKKIVGICLGMQLLFEKSYEFGACKGLSLIRGEVLSLNNHVKSQNKSIVPNIGWHRLKSSSKNLFFNSLKNKSFYFVHSFFVNPQRSTAIKNYIELEGKKVAAIINEKNIYGFQFHPEKSGKEGLILLKKFLKEVKG